MKSTLTRIVTDTTQNYFSDDPGPQIWIRIPFWASRENFWLKILFRKIKRNLTQPVKFVVMYDKKKISHFLPKKDKIPNSRSNIVYEFTCHGCKSSYTWAKQKEIMLLDCLNTQTYKILHLN